MQRRFPTIHDYHQRAPEISVRSAAWTSLRATELIEGHGDIRFARTDRNALVMTLDGTFAHLTRMDGIDDETPSRPGEICLVPEGIDLHLAWTNRHLLQQTHVLEFDTGLFAIYTPELLSEKFSAGHLRPENFAPRNGLEPLVRMLVREVRPETRRGRLFADTLIRLVALEVAASAWTRPMRPSPASAVPDRRVHRAVDYIEAHYAEDISLVEIAAVAGLSPTHLTGVFRREAGVTPYSYVINRRLRQAVHLLRNSDMPIAQVALEAGFADQQHLTRMVRARLRKTPKEVRQG
jgi:AraC family transcriptional regulator